MSLPARLSEPAPEPGRSAGWRRTADLTLRPPLLLAIFGVLAVGLFLSTWAAPFSRVIGAGPDPPLNLWYLRWIPFTLTHHLNPLYTNYLDYPGGVNVMWQTNFSLLGLLLWPITTTAGPVFAYNLLMTASTALSGWCATLAFRRHLARTWPAVIGGLLFAFSPYAIATVLGHVHVGVTFLCPLMLIVFEEAILVQQRSPWRLGLVIGILAAAQFLISEELLVTESLMALIAIVMLGSMYPDEVRRRGTYVARVALPATGALAAIAGWPIWMQFLGPQAVHGHLPWQNVFVSDLAGFVLPTSLQAVAPSAIVATTGRFAGTQYEAGAYIGAPLLLLIAIGARHWWRLRTVQAASLLLLLAMALSLGLTLHIGGMATAVPTGVLAVIFIPLMRTRAGRLLPAIFLVAWLALATAPLIDNVVPSRLMLYAFLFAGLLVSVFIDRVADSAPALRRSLKARALLVLMGLALISLLPRVPYVSSPVSVPSFFSSGARTIRDGAVVLVVPYAHDFESRAMLWQVSAGFRFRMPEGYANRPGPSLDPPGSALGQALIAMQGGAAAPPVSDAFRAKALATLASEDVSAIVLGPMDRQDRMVTFLSAVVGEPPTGEGGVYLWRIRVSDRTESLSVGPESRQGSQISLADCTSVIHQRPSMSTSV